METYEIESILLIHAYLARHHASHSLYPFQPTESEARWIRGIYESFLSSSYNLPYRPLRICIESYLDYLFEAGELAFLN